MPDQLTKRVVSLAVVVATAVGASWTFQTCHVPHEQALGISSIGGGPISGGGGGLRIVTNTANGILTGSGTVGNPELATVYTSGICSGSGSSGNPITCTEVGDIAGVTAGSGLINGGTTGTVTLDVGAGSGLFVNADTVGVTAGSGITADGTNTRVNEGSGMTWCSGAACVGQGSGMTIDATVIRTNLAGITLGAGSAVITMDRYGAMTGSAMVNSVAAGSAMSVSTTAGVVTVATNLTGGACTGGTEMTNISAFGVPTCTYVTLNDYTGTNIEWQDEFIADVASTAFWANTTAGAGATVSADQDPGGTRIGILEFGTGTTSTGKESYRSAASSILLGHGTWVVDWIWKVTTLSTSVEGYAVTVGMADTASAVDQVDGCYFLYDERNVASAPTTGAGNSSNLQRQACVCAANSVRTEYVMDGSVVSDSSFTTVSAPVAAGTWPSTNVINDEIIINAAGSEADFYVAGIKSCVITTHIPTAAGRYTNMEIGIIKSVGTTSRTLDFDKFHAKFTMASARTP